jgi:hypothetical protein
MEFVKEYTVEQFVKASTSGKTPSGKTYWTSEILVPRAGFYGCTSAEEAYKLGMYGWAPGREMVEKVKALIDGRLGNHNRQYTPVHDACGAYVDVGRYCEGVPECMLTYEETETPQTGFVWVHVSTGINGGVSSREIQLHGAAVGALVDALESAGQRVKLTWERSSVSQSGAARITLWMTLKEYDDALDMDRLAFFLTHNAPRRVMAWQEYLKSGIARSLGVSPGAAKCRPWSNRGLFGGADIHVAHLDIRNDEGAAKWVLEKLAEHGITNSE